MKFHNPAEFMRAKILKNRLRKWMQILETIGLPIHLQNVQRNHHKS